MESGSTTSSMRWRRRPVSAMSPTNHRVSSQPPPPPILLLLLSSAGARPASAKLKGRQPSKSALPAATDDADAQSAIERAPRHIKGATVAAQAPVPSAAQPAAVAQEDTGSAPPLSSCRVSRHVPASTSLLDRSTQRAARSRCQRAGHGQRRSNQLRLWWARACQCHGRCVIQQPCCQCVGCGGQRALVLSECVLVLTRACS